MKTCDVLLALNDYLNVEDFSTLWVDSESIRYYAEGSISVQNAYLYSDFTATGMSDLRAKHRIKISMISKIVVHNSELNTDSLYT